MTLTSCCSPKLLTLACSAVSHHALACFAAHCPVLPIWQLCYQIWWLFNSPQWPFLSKVTRSKSSNFSWVYWRLCISFSQWAAGEGAAFTLTTNWATMDDATAACAASFQINMVINSKHLNQSTLRFSYCKTQEQIQKQWQSNKITRSQFL